MERLFSLRNHRIILSSQCGDAICTVHRTNFSFPPWQDEVERVRMLSTLPHEEQLTFSPWQDKVERLFSLRNHRIILSSQCEDAFFTS
ncbi:hypothetical protein T07_7108 [Trichinella nelsoni]|uniref:Uncharacterized protein n=1 Tax=Trichinella nelsoni TaxID=6336 RepID=A0A0V0RBW9_9BILA|nr:hypothetical protein T07_7108 [Trichinella nelsoni]